MNPQVALGIDSPEELDERQRAARNEAAYMAYRAVMIALVIAFWLFSFTYDDDLITLTIGAVGLVGIITHWFYLRKAGLIGELDAIRARARYRRGFFYLKPLLMGVFIAAMRLSGSARHHQIMARDVVIAISMGVMFAVALSFSELRTAKQVIGIDEAGTSPDYTRGRRIGSWIARTFSRG